MAIATIAWRRPLLLALLAAVVILAGSPAMAARPGAAPLWHLVAGEAIGGFQAPVAVRHAGDARLFVAERAGVIRVLDEAGQIRPSPFLDIRQLVGGVDGERGLVGLAFHPDYGANGAFFVLYTGDDGDSRLDRYQVSADPNQADPNSRINLLTIPQPSPYHNGGDVVFGPDGYLYISLGDGGPLPGDPHNNAQNGQSLLGALLRLDVDTGSPYSVPADNPFVGDPETLDEIWATGLRNPWRFSFDRLTGDLYIGDVGEWEWEEIDVEPAGDPGGRNYGWRCYEGTAPYLPAGCAGTAVTFPVHTYGHRHGCAVVGGHVYRGSAYPALFGHYILGDLCGGRVTSFDVSGAGWRRSGVGYPGGDIVSLDEDVAGEMVAVAFNTGALVRFQPEPFPRAVHLPVVMRP